MNGLTTLQSDFPVKETIDRLVTFIQSHGMTVFLRFDHAANATQVGLELRPTELLLFGNPKAGTILMQDEQTAGIDLPVKALAWQEENGTVWLTINDANWIAERHGLTEKSSAVVKAIEDGMKMACQAATKL